MLITPTIILGISMLIILSVIDFLTFNKKNGYIPSVLTTLFLLIVFILGISNPTNTLFIGVFACLISLLFTDLDLWSGWADVKVFVAGAMAFPTLASAGVFALLVTIFAVVIKGVVVWRISKGKQGHIPFIPVILLAYLGAWVLI